MPTFPERLKQLRKKNQLTQQKLAEALGVNRVNITRWEKGNTEPNIVQLTDIAIYFNTSIDYLTGKIDKEYSEITDEEFKQMPTEELEESYENIISNALLSLSAIKLKGISKSQILNAFNTDEHKDFFPYIKALIDKVYPDDSNNNLTTTHSNKNE